MKLTQVAAQFCPVYDFPLAAAGCAGATRHTAIFTGYFPGERFGGLWFVVEQDTCPRNPFQPLEISFDFLPANLAA